MKAQASIEAGDLALEPQTAAHADAMFDVLSDAALYIYENAPPASRDALRARFLRLENRASPDGSEAWLNWVVRLAGGALIGYVQATVRPGGVAYVAYVFGSAHWGRGYATRAVQAMIDELRRAYGVHTVEAIAVVRNAPSLRLLQRLGFAPVPDGEVQCDDVSDGEVLWRRVL